ncbi:MAG: hypothetical protein B6D36_13540 [Planctomycetes bacterium UTPLA1]|nr:MAG: hypothetical protein B6D36_13540 [Planctomycetes bacterium UTPLA1]
MWLFRAGGLVAGLRRVQLTQGESASAAGPEASSVAGNISKNGVIVRSLNPTRQKRVVGMAA